MLASGIGRMEYKLLRYRFSCYPSGRKNGNDEHDGTKSRSRKHEEH